LIDNSVSIVRDLADKRHLDLRVAKDQSVPAYVVGDDNRLRLVLLNLLNNAIKFTRVGHVTLKVENLGTEENTARLHFAISDTGIGISSEKRGRLFQRFSQVDGSTSREYGGTGLGLAICKRLVELMDGEIGVESVEGEGSTFWFRVPLPVAAEASVTVAPPAGLAGLPPLRILLAEDVDVNQEIARAMLEAEGHRVDVVPDGGDAIMAVETNDYDVVRMDVQMPGVDGVSATKHIRALEGPVANVPIIAMTANVLPQQIQSFRAAGMDGHVGKPLSRAQLFAVLERCVSRACPSSNATSVQAETASNVLDAAMFADVTATLGPAKTSDLLRKLAAQLENRFPTDPRSAEEHAQLAREAHKLISTSGMFGFLTLSRSCARLEAAALDQSTDVTTLLQEVRGACRAALVEIVARVGQPGDLQKRG
jgi:CheY-like chemotaxis protein